MTTGQKIIKYCAMALAAFLVFTIVSSIFLALNVFSGLLGLRNDDNNNLEPVLLNSQDIKNIDLELATTQLEIISSDRFKIETNNDRIKIKQNHNKLIIKEEPRLIFNNLQGSKIILHLPEDVILNELSIDSGAGSIEANTIYAENFDLDIGAGSVNVANLYVSREANISGGLGALTIASGKINNLDLEVGIGKCVITALITGNSDIEAGIGALNINLLAPLSEYVMHLEKGIGSIIVNDEKFDTTTIGSGNNTINIEAGIGNVELSTIK